VEVDRHAGIVRLHVHPLGLQALGDELGDAARAEKE
jgi:hypothetical protein